MNIVRQNFSFSKFVELSILSLEDKKELDKEIKSWEMVFWEDSLLFQLFPFDNKITKDRVLEYKNILDVMRGDNLEINYLSDNEIENLKILDFAKNKESKLIMARTLYFFINFAYFKRARKILEKIEEQSLSGINFPDLTVEDSLFYKRIYVILVCNFFDKTKEEKISVLLHNDLFLLALRLGFDVDEIIKNYIINSSNLFKARTDLSVWFAGLLLDNHAIINPNSKDQKTIHDVIESCSKFSNNVLTNENFIKFLNKNNDDKNYLISLILEIYTHLVDGYSSGAVDLGKIKDKDNQSIFSKIVSFLTIKKISKDDIVIIKEWFKTLKNSEVAAVFIINLLKATNKNYKNEPFFSNILKYNDLFMEHYNIDDPILYYDENKKDFIINKKYEINLNF